MKKFHNDKISKREFCKGDKVLLFDLTLNLIIGKLKSKWLGTFVEGECVFEWIY